MDNYVFGTLVVLAIALAVAYNYGYLNNFLPSSWQKQTFIGSMGRYTPMQFCQAVDEGHGKRQPHFDRCIYMCVSAPRAPRESLPREDSAACRPRRPTKPWPWR